MLEETPTQFGVKPMKTTQIHVVLRDPHSLREAPTGAKLSEDSELSLELPWLILRAWRWDLGA